jgi:ABC-type transporter lipoprotein component MlaA
MATTLSERTTSRSEEAYVVVPEAYVTIRGRRHLDRRNETSQSEEGYITVREAYLAVREAYLTVREACISIGRRRLRRPPLTHPE